MTEPKSVTTLTSLTGTDPEWDAAEWADKWGTAFGQCIRDEIEHSNEPNILTWRVTGRSSKEWPNKEDMGFWSIKGVEFSRSYAQWRLNNPDYKLWVTPDGTPANELDFTVTFGSVRVRVIIDRVFVNGDELVIVDLKSGSSSPEDNLQLCVYAAAIDLKYGVRPNLGAYFSNRRGGIIGLEVLTEFTTQMMVDLFEDFVKQLNSAVYLPNPGRQCQWCEAAPHCKWGASLASNIRRT